MKLLTLSLALVAATISLPVLAQEGAQDAMPTAEENAWWQGSDYARASDNVAPDWLSGPGFGWQATPKVMANQPATFYPGERSWGVQARNALSGAGGVDANGQALPGNSAWSSSIDAAELRLAERLVKAQAAGEPYLVWVNLPAYRLRVLDTRDGGVLMESRVIVGKVGRNTPRMDTRIVNLKFNPDWSPPKSAAGKRYTPPGPRNPLGRVRFSTDNGIGIYLHDTNNHDLFNTPVRAYSLGCVRVEAWHDLALLLSGQDDAWIGRQTSDWRTKWVDVPDVPVFIDYQRVDFDDNGALVEHADIYRLGNRSR